MRSSMFQDMVLRLTIRPTIIDNMTKNFRKRRGNKTNKTTTTDKYDDNVICLRYVFKVEIIEVSMHRSRSTTKLLTESSLVDALLPFITKVRWAVLLDPCLAL